MKLLEVRDFQFVGNALNFDTPDCRVQGSCELYTTKAAGTDKKLYKDIDHQLEAQHESSLKLSASLPVGKAKDAAVSLNSARVSPFGSFANAAARKTFAYLIATLNAVHPDYDFSHVLRPNDFKREKSLKNTITTINSMLMSLRPKMLTSYAASNGQWSLKPATGDRGSPEPETHWGPHMWPKIDKEMDLGACQVFNYQPAEDPYDGDEPALWRMSYFFFNKEKKRVCYFWVKGLSVLSRSQQLRSSIGFGSRRRSHGSTKRAIYWLGERSGDAEGGWGEDDDDDTMMDDWDDDSEEVESDPLPEDLDEIEEMSNTSRPSLLLSEKQARSRASSEEILGPVDL